MRAFSDSWTLEFPFLVFFTLPFRHRQSPFSQTCGQKWLPLGQHLRVSHGFSFSLFISVIVHIDPPSYSEICLWFILIFWFSYLISVQLAIALWTQSGSSNIVSSPVPSATPRPSFPFRFYNLFPLQSWSLPSEVCRHLMPICLCAHLVPSGHTCLFLTPQASSSHGKPLDIVLQNIACSVYTTWRWMHPVITPSP